MFISSYFVSFFHLLFSPLKDHKPWLYLFHDSFFFINRTNLYIIIAESTLTEKCVLLLLLILMFKKKICSAKKALCSNSLLFLFSLFSHSHYSNSSFLFLIFFDLMYIKTRKLQIVVKKETLPVDSHIVNFTSLR